jgi:hypothetical protein
MGSRQCALSEQDESKNNKQPAGRPQLHPGRT